MQEDLLKNIIDGYKNELIILNENLENNFSLGSSYLSSISKYQIQTGGKRIRPLLIFIIAKLLSGSINKETIDFATCVELIHNATLVHDDIIDNSKLRRQKETVTEKFGTSKAILSGDFLFAYALNYALEFPKELNVKLRKTLIDLILGEAKELEYDLKKITIKECINIIENKTASLFSLSTLGSFLINSKENEKESDIILENIDNLGKNIGMCFQIMDDILDTFSNASTLGKEAGTDFIEKKPSLVVSLWLSKNTGLKDTYINLEKVSNNDFQNIKKEILDLNIIDEAKAIFDDYYDAACVNIDKALSDYSNNSNMLDIKNYLFFIKSKILDF